MASDPSTLAAADRDLLERVAARIVELKLEVPAVLTLETLKPISVVTGQAMLFFEPIVAALLRLPDYRRFAGLIERREALEALLVAIERGADAREAARRAGAGGRS